MSFVEDLNFDNSKYMKWTVYILAIYTLYEKYKKHKQQKATNAMRNTINAQLEARALMQSHNSVEPAENIVAGPDVSIINNSLYGMSKRPEFLTSNVVIPNTLTSTEEAKRTARMEVFNMQYNGFEDDALDIYMRPNGLYVTP